MLEYAAPAASNNETRYKNVQKWSENNHLVLIIWIIDTHCISGR
jgi:hypothetical protein